MVAAGARHVVIRSRDLDDARRKVSELFSPHELSVVDGSRSIDVQVSAWCGKDVTIARVRHGAEVHVRPGRLDTYYDINIPLRGYTRTRNGTEELDSNRARGVVLTATRESTMHWSTDCEQLAVKIDRSLVERTVEAALGRPLDGAVVFKLGWDLTRGAGSTWLHSVELLRQALAGDASALVVRPLEEVLVAQLITGQLHTFSDQLAGGPPRPQLRSVARVIEQIEADPAASWTIAEMAAVARTSVRTLQMSFADRLGITPSQFLRNVRLARSREDLVAAGPGEGVTVSAVASRWGFNHLPRFAAAYRDRYGETPSQTLHHG